MRFDHLGMEELDACPSSWDRVGGKIGMFEYPVWQVVIGSTERGAGPTALCALTLLVSPGTCGVRSGPCAVISDLGIPRCCGKFIPFNHKPIISKRIRNLAAKLG